MTQESNNVQAIDRPDMPADYGLAEVTGGSGLLAWEWLSERMAAARNYWIHTTRPDGRPHVAPVWGLWVDERFYFGTHSQSRKARNAALNPAVAVNLESGDEVVILDGTLDEVHDPALLRRLNEAYEQKYGLAALDESGDTPTFVLRVAQAMAWLETDFPNTATRWRFGNTS